MDIPPARGHGWVMLCLLAGHRWQVTGDRLPAVFGGFFAGEASDDEAAMAAAETCASEKFGVVFDEASR